jgi:Cu+-exporting ATPase
MSVADISVLLAAVVAIGGLGWFFFGPRRAHSAQLGDGVQRAVVTVKGGYSPDVIKARQGVPLEIAFDRQESGDCTSRVVFPELNGECCPATISADHGAAGPGQRGHVRFRVWDEHGARHARRRAGW